jgi:hypothetical protein
VFVDKDLYTSQEILASAFNPNDEKLLVTLTGDLILILWQWESGQYLAREQIRMKGVATDSLIPYQVSYKPRDYDSSPILVTGPSTFVYLKVKTRKKAENDGQNNYGEKEKKETMFEFEVVHS